MGKKKSKSKSPQKHLTPQEIIFREKHKKFLRAIEEYWLEQTKLYDIFNKTALSFESVVTGEEFFPRDLSNLIWLLRDGVVFIRYKTEGSRKGLETRILEMPLNDWFEHGWIIPIKGKDVSLAGIIHGSANNVTFKRCTFNEFFIDFANFSFVRYDQPQLTPTLSKALIDFKLTLLGMIFQMGGAIIPHNNPQEPISPEKVLEQLQQKVTELKNLLNGEVNEENLQDYLKKNPFLLKSASEIIPKQKLGEDFVTDFVILNILDQGPVYTLVELEKSSHPILTQDNVLTSNVNHAVRQTRDWDIWLENNKAYLQNRLPGFESPKYLIVIGRTKDMDASQKAYVRSYNRLFNNICILSYDDLVSQTEELIGNLQTVKN